MTIFKGLDNWRFQVTYGAGGSIHMHNVSKNLAYEAKVNEEEIKIESTKKQHTYPKFPKFVYEELIRIANEKFGERNYYVFNQQNK